MRAYTHKKDESCIVEINNKFYQASYGEDDWKEIELINHDELIEINSNDIDLPEWITNCDVCKNRGFINYDEDGVLLCDCYHAKDGHKNAEKLTEIMNEY